MHNHFEKENSMSIRNSYRRGGPRAAHKSLLAGLSATRNNNPPKKKTAAAAKRRRNGSKLVKGSAAAKARMAALRALRGSKSGGAKRKRNPPLRGFKAIKARAKRRRNPAAGGVASAIALATRQQTKKRGYFTSGNAGYDAGLKSGRILNGRKPRGRKRSSISARRRNPSFDIKQSLIESAVLIGGVYAGGMIMGFVEKQLESYTGLNPATRGYLKLLGAAATIVAGDYITDKYGSKIGFDIKPATYAIATLMAHSGMVAAGLTQKGTIALTGPLPSGGSAGNLLDYGTEMQGTMGLILPNYEEPNAMLGTMGLILPNYDEPNAMLGSIFTDSQLPFPAVAPHSVMQASPDDFPRATFGQQVVAPVMC
jgi:hypothetical protein